MIKAVVFTQSTDPDRSPVPGTAYRAVSIPTLARLSATAQEAWAMIESPINATRRIPGETSGECPVGCTICGHDVLGTEGDAWSR